MPLCCRRSWCATTTVHRPNRLAFVCKPRSPCHRTPTHPSSRSRSRLWPRAYQGRHKPGCRVANVSPALRRGGGRRPLDGLPFLAKKMFGRQRASGRGGREGRDSLSPVYSADAPRGPERIAAPKKAAVTNCWATPSILPTIPFVGKGLVALVALAALVAKGFLGGAAGMHRTGVAAWPAVMAPMGRFLAVISRAPG